MSLRALKQYSHDLPSSPRRPSLSTSHREACQFHLAHKRVSYTCIHTDWSTLTKPGIGVLVPDALSPVLAEEHVRGQSPLRRLGVLLGLARRLFSFDGGLALRNEW